MKYQIGDKVELDNGSVVEITNIHKNMSDAMYLAGVVPVPEEKIVRKIED